MKTLLLLRHAKSSRDDPALRDFDRPLTARGRKAAASMGRLLSERGLLPDLILSSPARRARETCERLAPELAGAPEARFEERLYMAEASILLRIARGLADDAGTALLIGHNPGIERFAGQLAGIATGDAGQRLAAKFPTAGLAVLRFDAASWTALSPGAGRLEAFVTPRETDD
jgi:phosphohistidine phosphatase